MLQRDTTILAAFTAVQSSFFAREELHLMPSTALVPSKKRYLNAGSGRAPARRILPLVESQAWEEIRLDVDQRLSPNVVGSVTDIEKFFTPSSFDAVWCSHVMEHLYAHEVYPTLLKFRDILKPDGFALIFCPDLHSVAQYLLEHGLSEVAYNSPSGPIRPLDMIYGHSRAIERGQHHMAHRTGFTVERLGNLLLKAGFPIVKVRSDNYEICALAFMRDAKMKEVQEQLATCGLDFREADEY